MKMAEGCAICCLMVGMGRKKDMALRAVDSTILLRRRGWRM